MIGAVIALLLVDWAIIILSSLAGATMIAAEIPVEHQIRLAILAGLAVVGIIFQRSRLTRSQMRAPLASNICPESRPSRSEGRLC